MCAGKKNVSTLNGKRYVFLQSISIQSSVICNILIFIGSGVEILSPTSNLPNFVIEGTSPYHRCCSSASKQKENWLMKLQATPSPKPAEKVTTKRKSQTTPKVCRGNLLKFFKVSAKKSPVIPNGCDAQKESPVVQESPTIKS